MPNITKRKNKAGEVISYRIRVSRGYDSEGNKLKPHEMTWKPSPNMTPRQAEKEAQRQALLFEEQFTAIFTVMNFLFSMQNQISDFIPT